MSKSQGHAPIAQLDRVTDYESVGRGFESLSAYQSRIIRTTSAGSDYFYIFRTRTINSDCPVDRQSRRLDGAKPLVRVPFGVPKFQIPEPGIWNFVFVEKDSNNEKQESCGLLLGGHGPVGTD